VDSARVADSVTNGVYTTGDQSIAGVKTFSSPPGIPAATLDAQALQRGQINTANSSEIKTALNANGSAPIYACRAWVNFDGSIAAIRSSGNVSSITKNGTGDYRVNFATAMPDTNYAVASSDAHWGIGFEHGYTTTSVTTKRATTSFSLIDVGWISLSVFR
jgi:hypothetical protein